MTILVSAAAGDPLDGETQTQATNTNTSLTPRNVFKTVITINGSGHAIMCAGSYSPSDPSCGSKLVIDGSDAGGTTGTQTASSGAVMTWNRVDRLAFTTTLVVQAKVGNNAAAFSNTYLLYYT